MSDKKELKHTERWKQIADRLGPEGSEELRQAIEEAMEQPPRIAVIGKAGVGKTTTINNLFDVDWVVGNIDTGTKRDQEAEFELLAGGKLAVVDMPGLGEDLEQDEVYKAIYQDVLPNVDLVLYVMQANARDLEEDQLILQDIVLPMLSGRESRIVLGINKVDNIGPGNWIEAANYPSRQQEKSIRTRSNDIADKLSNSLRISPDQIVYYSALKAYRLNQLGEALVIAANELGWKLPLSPKNFTDGASDSVRKIVNTFFPWTKSRRD